MAVFEPGADALPDETAGSPVRHSFDMDPTESGIPDDIEEFKARVGVKNVYSATLKRKFLDGGDDAIVGTFQNRRPGIETIGKQYGPGRYEIAFVFKGTGTEKGVIKKEYEFTISEEYALAHEEWLADQQEKAEELRQKRQERALEKARLVQVKTGTLGDAGKTPTDLQKLIEAKQTLQALGVDVGGSRSSGGGFFSNFENIIALLSLPVMGKIVDAVMGSRKSGDTELRALIQQLGNTQGNKSEAEMIGSLTTTFKAALSAVQAASSATAKISEPKKDAVERLLEMAERLLPMMLKVQGPLPGYMKDAVENDPDVQEVKSQEALKEKLFTGLREKYTEPDVLADIVRRLEEVGIKE